MITTRYSFSGLVMGAWLLTCSPNALAVVIAVEWINPAAGDYSDASNWDPTVATPCNVGTLEFEVTVPIGGPVNQDVPTCTVSSFELADDRSFRPQSNTAYTVGGIADLLGIVDARGGDFTTANGEFPGDRARVYAEMGAQVVIGATSYDSTGLTFSGPQNPTVTTTHLFTAHDPGTLLDVSSLQSIDAGFAPNSNDVNRHEVTASTGAALDLSGVQSVTGPVSSRDWIRFNVSDEDTVLNLGNLVTVTSLATVTDKERGQTRL